MMGMCALGFPLDVCALGFPYDGVLRPWDFADQTKGQICLFRFQRVQKGTAEYRCADVSGACVGV